MEGIAGAEVLELGVKRCYQTSRTAEAVLASVYEQIVATHRRSLAGSPGAEAGKHDFSKQQKPLCAGG